MKRNKPTTIEDVARLAGVSRQTVSRVINNRDQVAAATETRVLDAIRELDFRPNATARSLASRRTYILGIVTADFSDYTHARIIEGAEAKAQELGYMIFISSAGRNEDGEPISSPLLNQHQVEGLFIVYHGSSRDTHTFFQNIPADLPVVTIGYAPTQPNVSTVNIDNHLGARQVGEHLLQLGHRRIAQITGPRVMYEAQERCSGFLQVFKDGSELDTHWEEEGDWSIDRGYQAAQQLLQRAPDLTAMFVHNDRMAMGALQALREGGKRVPEDVSVIGFDDIPTSAYYYPPLTTVHHPFYLLGQTGIQMLIDRIDGRAASGESIRLGTELVVRDSCIELYTTG